MLPGALTQHIDVAQVVTWAFLLLFVGLVVYLRHEDRREGYPLADPASRGRLTSEAPAPKPYVLMDGRQTTTPHDYEPPPMQATPPRYDLGYGIQPMGDPLVSAVGPSTYVMRADRPFTDPQGELCLQPLRVARGWSVVPGDTDPRGLTMVDGRRGVVGTVVDLWVDREVRILRYLEVELVARPRTVLVPIYAADVRSKEVRVRELRAPQFADVPVLAHPDRITAREEDQVNAYFAGGAFFNRETARHIARDAWRGLA